MARFLFQLVHGTAILFLNGDFLFKEGLFAHSAMCPRKRFRDIFAIFS